MDEITLKLLDEMRVNISFKNVKITYIDENFENIKENLLSKDCSILINYLIKSDNHKSDNEDRFEQSIKCNVVLTINNEKYKIGQIDAIYTDFNDNIYINKLNITKTKENIDTLYKIREYYFRVVIIDNIINAIVENVSRYTNIDIIGLNEDNLNDIIIECILKIRKALDNQDMNGISDVFNKMMPLIKTKENFEKVIAKFEKFIPEITNIEIINKVLDDNYNGKNYDNGKDEDDDEDSHIKYKFNPDLLN